MRQTFLAVILLALVLLVPGTKSYAEGSSTGFIVSVYSLDMGEFMSNNVWKVTSFNVNSNEKVYVNDLSMTDAKSIYSYGGSVAGKYSFSGTVENQSEKVLSFSGTFVADGTKDIRINLFNEKCEYSITTIDKIQIDLAAIGKSLNNSLKALYEESKELAQQERYENRNAIAVKDQLKIYDGYFDPKDVNTSDLDTNWAFIEDPVFNLEKVNDIEEGAAGSVFILSRKYVWLARHYSLKNEPKDAAKSILAAKKMETLAQALYATNKWNKLYPYSSRPQYDIDYFLKIDPYMANVRENKVFLDTLKGVKTVSNKPTPYKTYTLKSAANKAMDGMFDWTNAVLIVKDKGTRVGVDLKLTLRGSFRESYKLRGTMCGYWVEFFDSKGNSMQVYAGRFGSNGDLLLLDPDKGTVWADPNYVPEYMPYSFQYNTFISKPSLEIRGNYIENDNVKIKLVKNTITISGTFSKSNFDIADLERIEIGSYENKIKDIVVIKR